MKYCLSVSISPCQSNYVDCFDTLEECENAVFSFKEVVLKFNKEASQVCIAIHPTSMPMATDTEDDED